MEKIMRKCFLLLMIGLITLGAISTMGCAGRTKSSTVSTQSTSGGAGSTTTSVTTQNQTVTTSAHPRGVIGGLFYTIGQVIIWPFKVIGSLF